MDYLAINRETWNKRTEIHVESDFYDIDGFLSGNCTLNDIELSALGDVTNKTLLHLQCHFGLDTLSWARRGAKVTGVDLSNTAIDKATKFSNQTQLDANFICSDVYSFDDINNQQFDIVFTSYGTICWLPCLKQWAKVIVNSLKKGGTFYIAEFHPCYDLISGYSYFDKNQPDIEEEATYSENAGDETSKVVLWPHAISSVINALIDEGLVIEHVNEFPYSPYNCFEGLTEIENGKFALLHKEHNIPLVFSIKATKPK
ncbi:SAM-dependent methyltransferase [Parashewanella curva]|uniref:SAM-dependent methyltransferase n=1 Tax=Parashewanella curva TaxID=2338552 RepID=A0A3L8PTN3_9GAMM|nr:class I SAM-dependent methyltransferase [Parashewanella curva]RLV58654.1 SAM-dependent methyltransferase [Parashewanella curva]